MGVPPSPFNRNGPALTLSSIVFPSVAASCGAGSHLEILITGRCEDICIVGSSAIPLGPSRKSWTRVAGGLGLNPRGLPPFAMAHYTVAASTSFRQFGLTYRSLLPSHSLSLDGQ